MEVLFQIKNSSERLAQLKGTRDDVLIRLSSLQHDDPSRSTLQNNLSLLEKAILELRRDELQQQVAEYAPTTTAMPLSFLYATHELNTLMGIETTPTSCSRLPPPRSPRTSFKMLSLTSPPSSPQAKRANSPHGERSKMLAAILQVRLLMLGFRNRKESRT